MVYGMVCDVCMYVRVLCSIMRFCLIGIARLEANPELASTLSFPNLGISIPQTTFSLAVSYRYQNPYAGLGEHRDYLDD